MSSGDGDAKKPDEDAAKAESSSKSATSKDDATSAKDDDAKADAKVDAKADAKADAKPAAKADDAKSDAKKRADSDGDDDTSASSSDKIPKARVVAGDAGESHAGATAGEPAARPSAVDLRGALKYPDDGPFARGVRKLDDTVGLIEQVGLVTTLALVVLVAAAHAVLDKVAGIQIELKGEIVRTGTFAIAIFGGVFATHQARHLAMDLISRRLSPRNRLILKVVLALFACFIVGLMFKAGFKSIETEKSMQHHEKLLTSGQIAWMIPIGSALIIFHFFLHTLIDINYLLRGKTPPERMRSGH